MPLVVLLVVFSLSLLLVKLSRKVYDFPFGQDRHVRHAAFCRRRPFCFYGRDGYDAAALCSLQDGIGVPHCLIRNSCRLGLFMLAGSESFVSTVRAQKTNQFPIKMNQLGIKPN